MIRVSQKVEFSGAAAEALSAEHPSRGRRPPLLIGVEATILGCFAVCLAADVRVATWVHAGTTQSTAVAAAALAGLESAAWWIGHFVTTAVVASALLVWRRHRPRRAMAGAAQVVVSAVIAGLSCSVLKWAVGRTRPFKGVDAFALRPLRGGLHGLIACPPNESFPSGHAALAFATATAVATLAPRARWAALALAIFVACFRVLSGAHYPSDVVAGAAVGLVAASAARRLVVGGRRRLSRGVARDRRGM
jgi:membrane-associated phospholipid phosphatase